MYDFLKQAAGLDSKDELLIRAMEEDEDEVQIEENDPFWGCENEDEEDPYEWVWEKTFPILEFNPYEYYVDWDCVTPSLYDEIVDYIMEIEDILSLNFPDHIYETDLSELFLYVDENTDGTVTISVDRNALIDYLIEEC